MGLTRLVLKPRYFHENALVFWVSKITYPLTRKPVRFSDIDYPCFTICLILAPLSWPFCFIVMVFCCATSPRSLPASLTFFTACCAVSFTSLAACETRSATCWAYCWTCSGSGRALRSCCQRSFKKRCVFSLRIRRTTEPVTTPAPTPMRSPLTTRFMLQSPFCSEALEGDLSSQHCCCSTSDEDMSLLILVGCQSSIEGYKQLEQIGWMIDS